MNAHQQFYKTSTQISRKLRGIIGGNIHHLRRDKGLTLGQLSTQARLSERRLDWLEIGKGEVSLNDIARLATALKIDVMELLTGPVKGKHST